MRNPMPLCAELAGWFVLRAPSLSGLGVEGFRV